MENRTLPHFPEIGFNEENGKLGQKSISGENRWSDDITLIFHFSRFDDEIFLIFQNLVISCDPPLPGSMESLRTDVRTGDGSTVGTSVGADVGSSAGSDIGTSVGADVGFSVGSEVGTSVGVEVGSDVGSSVGWSCAHQATTSVTDSYERLT